MNRHDLKRLMAVIAMSTRASGGGRSRAATLFACGTGTLWRGHAHRRAHAFVPPPRACIASNPPASTSVAYVLSVPSDHSKANRSKPPK